MGHWTGLRGVICAALFVLSVSCLPSPVSSAAQPSAEKAEQYGVRAVFFLVQVTTERLTMIREMIDAGALQSEVGEVLWLDEARQGHEMLEGAPHRRGKIVIKVAD